MARTTSVQSLTRSIQHLRSQRRKHVDAIDAIDATFSQIGITGSGVSRRGRPPAKKTRRKRGRYAQNAEAFVLRLLKAKALTTAELNAAWKRAGRAGVSNSTLTKLAKAKRIKRAAVKGGRGSSYSLV